MTTKALPPKSRVQLDRYAYDIVDVKKGGMGTVWLVRRERGIDPIYRRDLALKTFDAAEDEEEAQIEQELGNWARLWDPHIVPMIKIARMDFGLCAMMPLRQGSLRDHLRLHGVLGSGDFKRVMLDVLRALECAQRDAGVAHLDLKPDNILVEEANPLSVQVSDWGLSRLMSSSRFHHDWLSNAKAWAGRQTRDVTAFAGGTFPYMAPERFLGNWEIGPAADVFSVGIIACEMLTGRKPTVGSTGTQDECISLILSGKYVEIARYLLANTAGRLAQLVLQMLEPNPGNRPTNYITLIQLFEGQ